jgi:hypothetical protein
MGEDNMKDQKKSLFAATWIIALSVLFAVAFAVATFGPSPYKQWGGAISVTMICSLVLMRAMDEIIGIQRAGTLMPYVASTFAVMTLIMFFAPMDVARVATYALFVIVGLSCLYWLVHRVVSFFKRDKTA